MNLSKTGLQLLKTSEGFRSHVYSDVAGFATIGYGHKLNPGESYPNGITEGQASTLLNQDVASAEKVVDRPREGFPHYNVHFKDGNTENRIIERAIRGLRPMDINWVWIVELRRGRLMRKSAICANSFKTSKWMFWLLDELVSMLPDA
jgi:hypothetical protein